MNEINKIKFVHKISINFSAVIMTPKISLWNPCVNYLDGYCKVPIGCRF